MNNKNIDGYIIPKNDQFFSEYSFPNRLKLISNFSGSAGSSIRVEIQNSLGYAVPEFSMDKCEEIFGDNLKRIVSWRSDSSLASLNGIPVRLRIELKDADLYSFKFTKDKVHDI